jgi:hypothetical protein
VLVFPSCYGVRLTGQLEDKLQLTIDSPRTKFVNGSDKDICIPVTLVL